MQRSLGAIVRSTASCEQWKTGLQRNNKKTVRCKIRIYFGISYPHGRVSGYHTWGYVSQFHKWVSGNHTSGFVNGWKSFLVFLCHHWFKESKTIEVLKKRNKIQKNKSSTLLFKSSGSWSFFVFFKKCILFIQQGHKELIKSDSIYLKLIFCKIFNYQFVFKESGKNVTVFTNIKQHTCFQHW